MRYRGWRERLIAAIDADDRSERRISLDAGLGPNYVGQLIKNNGAEVDSVLKLCAALNLSVSYIFTGVEMNTLDEEMLIRFSALPLDQKQAFASLLRSFERADEAPQ